NVLSYVLIRIRDCVLLYTMADVNINAPADQAPTMAPPTHTGDQNLPHIRWGLIGKSNCYLDFEKAFTASSTIPSIYIQQFWDTVRYDKTAGCYKCQLDEQWFDLTKETLRDALQITPVNNNKAFSSPLSSDALINFVNELGYLKLVTNLSNVRKHKFHPRPDSLFHLPNEEPVLGYLNDPDSLAPKPTKATKKSKPSAPKVKKRKLVTEISDKPSPARKSRPVLVSKRRKAISSLRLIDESVTKGIPEKEPRVDDEEADVARDLLTLQTPKKKSLADQYIFQRPTSTPTGSSGHDESSSLYVELGLTDNEVESNEDVPGIDNQTLVIKMKARLDQTLMSKTKARLDQTLVMLQRFTATAYPKVQENLKLTVEEQVILEEPASSTWTFSSLQHLTKDLSFGDLFFNDKPLEADNEKTTAETKAKSMVSIIIQQDTSSIPPMKTPVIDLTSRPESPNVHHPLQAIATETTTIATIHPPPPQPQQSTID
nr:hypothetical protein [Tanacetum cinerariifolium]